VLGIGDSEVEVEYQTDTIGKYGLAFEDGVFRLVGKKTDCLAKDNCGAPAQKVKRNLSEVQGQASCCGENSGSGCCN
jgi:hypothetical protein